MREYVPPYEPLERDDWSDNQADLTRGLFLKAGF